MEEFDNSSDSGSYYQHQSDSETSKSDGGEGETGQSYRAITSAALNKLQVRYHSSWYRSFPSTTRIQEQ